jgi:hypothetical protein
MTTADLSAAQQGQMSGAVLTLDPMRYFLMVILSLVWGQYGRFLLGGQAPCLWLLGGVDNCDVVFRDSPSDQHRVTIAESVEGAKPSTAINMGFKESVPMGSRPFGMGACHPAERPDSLHGGFERAFVEVGDGFQLVGFFPRLLVFQASAV